MNLSLASRQPRRYRPFQRGNVQSAPFWGRLSPEVREAVSVVSTVLPFRTNEYVVRELIDWDTVPDDPIFQLTFPQRGMLAESDYERMAALVRSGASKAELEHAAGQVRRKLNPHPAGQATHNVPSLDGRRLEGIQHKYRETVLFFPAQGQTCHAYCSFCFRWPQFVDSGESRFENREIDVLIEYLRRNPQVTDVILTGGDPMVMRTSVLRQYVEPLLEADLPSLRTLRIGTKALSFWPARFVTDDDSEDLLRLFERVVRSGIHLAMMLHVSHPRELMTAIASEAVRRLRNSGATLFTQSPLIRHVNDDPAAWTRLWSDTVRLGITPYYMFVERNTGAKRYFELPLVEAHRIHQEAARQVSGLARTVRGPVMSAFAGKVEVLGPLEGAPEEALSLQFLQARDPERVYRPFRARLDLEATWFDELEPFAAEDEPFFE